MIGEEEKTAQQIEELVKEQKISNVRDLKVKLGVTKEQETDQMIFLADLSDSQVV